MMAQIDQSLNAIAFDREFRCPITFRLNANFCRKPFNDGQVQVHELSVRLRKDGLEGRQNRIDKGRPCVELSDRFGVLALPSLPLVDFGFENRLVSQTAMENRNGKPQRSARPLYPITVSPSIFVKSNVVVMHEHVRSVHLIEVSEPRQVTRL